MHVAHGVKMNESSDSRDDENENAGELVDPEFESNLKSPEVKPLISVIHNRRIFSVKL